MGRKLNLSHLSEEECESILNVIQRDFNLREKEKERLKKSETELISENEKRKLLSASSKFNENCCIRCCATFGLFFNRKRVCHGCRFNVCSNCSEPDKHDKLFICSICVKQRDLLTQSCDWFYTDVNKRFKRFGSAKVVRSLHKRDPDTASDCGGYKYSDRPRPTVQGLFESIFMNPVVASNGNEPKSVEESIAANSVENVASEIPTVDTEKSFQNSPIDTSTSGMRKKLENGDYDWLRSDGTNELFGQARLEKWLNTSENSVEQTIARQREAALSSYSSEDRLLNPKHSQLQRYQNELTDIRGEIEKILASNTTENGHSAINADNLALAPHKTRISNALRNLAQGLYMAHNTGDEEFNDNEVNKQVQEFIIEEVETYVGEQLNLPLEEFDDFISSHDSSDVESIPESHVSQAPVQDSLAHAIVVKIVYDYNEAEDARIAKLKEDEAIRELEELAMFSQEIQSQVQVAKPVARQVIEEVDSEEDYSAEEEEIIPLSAEREQYMRTPTRFFDESDNISNGSPHSFGPHPNFIQTQLLVGKSSPLPSFEPSPLGRDEIDFDNFSSLKNNNELDGDGEGNVDENGDDNTEFNANNWLLKGRMGAEEYQLNTSASGFKITMPQFSHRSSPMIGNRDVDELSDLTSVGADDLTDDDDEGGDNDTVASLSSVEELDEETSDHNTQSKTHRKLSTEEPATTSTTHSSQTFEMNGNYDDKIGNVEKTDSKLVYNSTTGVLDETIIKAVENVVVSKDVCTDPVFDRLPVDVSVPEGEMMRFSCQVSGTSPIDVFWYRDGGIDIDQLEDNDKYDIYKHGNDFYLDVYNTHEKDAGGYLCIGINEQGQCSHTVQSKITENPLDKHKPEFIKLLEDIEVIEGQSAKFSVKVKGYPIAKVTWYKDGKKIKASDDKFKMSRIGNRHHELLISCAMIEEDAEYAVIASNVAGQAKTYAQLIVEPAPKPIESPRTPRRPASLPTALNTSKTSEVDKLGSLTDKVTKTRTNVTNTAENVLSSARKISNIDRDLDEMEQRLNNMESNVMSTDVVLRKNLPAADEDSDESIEDILARYSEKKKAAANIRAVTSTALDLIADAEPTTTTMNVANSTVTPIVRAKVKPNNSSQEYDLSKVNLNDSNISEIISTAPESEIQLTNFRAISSSPVPSPASDVTHSTIESNIQSKYSQPLSIEIDNAAYHRDDRSALDIPNNNFERVDCGLKRVDSKRYKRDYLINRTQAMEKKNLNARAAQEQNTKEVVNNVTEKLENFVCETEDEPTNEDVTPAQLSEEDRQNYVYMVAGDMFSLEEKIKKLESKINAVGDDTSPEIIAALEEEVARAVAQVSQSEKRVTHVENHVVDLNNIVSNPAFQSQYSFNSEPDSVADSGLSTGATTPVDLMSPRSSLEQSSPVSYSSSINEENITLPSVKRLSAIFDAPPASPKSAHCKRVRSLTARTPVMVPSRSTGSPVVMRRSLAPNSPQQRPKSDNFETRGRSSPSEVKRLPYSSPMKEASPKLLLGQKPRTFTLPTDQSSADQSSSNIVYQSPKPSPSSENANVKKGGNIRARAAFWDSRINDCVTSDHDIQSFPAGDTNYNID